MYETLLFDGKISMQDNFTPSYRDSEDGKLLIRNKMFTGTKAGQPFLDYALLNLIADAPTGAKVDEVAKRKDKKRPEFEDMIKNGKNLVGKKDVTDTTPCKDTIKELEEKWRELADILGERQNANRARKQSLNAYEALREQVNNWLSKMERKLEEMDPIALEPDLLKRQIDELKPLVTEHGSYSKTIEKLYEKMLDRQLIMYSKSQNCENFLIFVRGCFGKRPREDF